jgi:hypothetical protein
MGNVHLRQERAERAQKSGFLEKTYLLLSRF